MSFLNNLSVIKVSVIVPTYMPKEYLWECLDSLVRQTFPKDAFEVIIVLNGCCEPWKSKIERYISKNMTDMQVRFIQTDESGVSNARNIGLDCAQGKFVTFVDDDDYVSLTYLEGLYKVSSEDTIGLCYPYAFNDGKPNIQISYSITDSYNKLKSQELITYHKARKFFAGPCMKLIPMCFIYDRRFNVRFKNGEDALFNFLISDKFTYVAFASSDAVYYRRYRENSAVTANRTRLEKISNAVSLGVAFTRIYLKSPGRYSLPFYITRMLAVIHSMIV